MQTTVSFNTGRKYTARGQVIVATLHADGVITFMDHSRMISGEIAASQFHTPDSIQRHTMRAYDNYAYQESRRSREAGMLRGGCNTEEAFEAQAAAAARAEAEAEAEVLPGATYSESAQGVTITRARALHELKIHGLTGADDVAAFYADVGDAAEYDAQTVLQWLGY